MSHIEISKFTVVEGKEHRWNSPGKANKQTNKPKSREQPSLSQGAEMEKLFLSNGVNKDFYFYIDRHPPNLA